jgi:hypothetical protein
MPEANPLLGKNLGFSGTGWVGTNGQIVVFTNGLCFSVAPIADISHPVAWDVPLREAVSTWNFFKAILEGDDFYVLLGDQIQHWSLEDPAHPRLVSLMGDCHFTAGGLWDFIVKDGHPIVAGGPPGVIVLDPADDGRVTLENTLPLPQGMWMATSIARSGNYVIIYDGSNGGIGVYDFADVSSPTIVGSAPCPGYLYVTGLFYRAPHLIITYGLQTDLGGVFPAPTQLAIFDFPDLSDPGSLNPVPVNADAPVLIGGNMSGVVIQGDHLFCASGVQVLDIDVSTPSTPIMSACFDESSDHYWTYINSVAVVDDKRFVADRIGLAAFDSNGNRTGRLITGAMVSGGFYYFKPLSLSMNGSLGLLNLGGEGVATIDFTSAHPRRLGFWENTTGGTNGFVNDSVISIDGTYAYVATIDETPGALFRGGVQVLDLLDPSHPIQIGACQIPISQGEWFPTDLTFFHGRYLLAVMADAVTGNFRLDILDLQNPAAPALVSTYGVAPGTPIEGLSVADVGGRSFAILGCGHTPDWKAQVQTVELTDLKHPVLRVALDTQFWGEAASVALAQVGETLYGYVAISNDGDGNFVDLVINLSDPSNAETTRVACWAYSDEYEAFDTIHPIRSPWGPLLVTSSGWANPYGSFSRLWDLTGNACPNFWGEGTLGCSWVSQAPGDNLDLFVSVKYFGVGVARVPPYAWHPTVVGPFEPPDYTNIVQPTMLSIQGVSSPVGIADVQFYATQGSCWYSLGKVTTPSDTGTYSVLFDPATIPEAMVSLQAVAEDVAGNAWSYFGGAYYRLGPDDPLAIHITASPSTGIAPLAVGLTASVSGGRPPYDTVWQFGDGPSVVARGPYVEHTYKVAGDFTAFVRVQDDCYRTGEATELISVLNPPDPPPVIQAVQEMTNPFRLNIAGSCFTNPCWVNIGGTFVPKSVFVNAGSLVAGSGKRLKKMCPKGETVFVSVKNLDGQVSAPFPYTR